MTPRPAVAAVRVDSAFLMTFLLLEKRHLGRANLHRRGAPIHKGRDVDFGYLKARRGRFAPPAGSLQRQPTSQVDDVSGGSSALFVAPMRSSMGAPARA